MASTVTAGLTQEGYRYRSILPGTRARKVSADTYEVDFGSPESLQELRQLLVGSTGETIGAVINFLGISQPYVGTGCASGEAALQVTLWSFQFLKEFANDLVAAAQHGGGTVMNLTALDGKLGLGRGGRMALTSSGLTGLFKTFQQEYPTLRVKTVDLDLAAGNPLMGARLVEELQQDDNLVEVGLSATGRSTVKLSLSTAHPTQLGPLPIDKSSVVLITGGANGITYDAALRLAKLAQPTLVLVGRSPLPEQEGDETRDLDTAKLRMHLIQQRKAQGQPMVPAQIEQNLRRILKDRQILDNLATLEETGATVEYHSMDVRDEDAFGPLLDDVYARFGRIDGVIHGAGVIEDKLIKDKTPQSYSNVFSTKVDSALILAKRLKPADLKFLVFSSSVSGRFGNGGQADYSAANEFLNKLADDLDRKWPGRVVAVNWGAWDAGMVSDELRKAYASRGLYMIPIPDGVQFLENELRLGNRGEPEVTIACSIPKLVEMVTPKR
ncbi:MAG: SDR family NAD(P)-dependent oxidoreductase [Planctomycetaceae bacterium]|nr:SDR family NAD(P)-dependent oxidoreductase [Planctomycetaceae bacterium]